MLKFSLEQANDQNLAAALQKLASMEKIDPKLRYRAGRIFDTVCQSMRAFQKDMESIKKEFLLLEDGKPKQGKDGNVIWNAPDAQEKFAEEYKKGMEEGTVSVKALPLQFAELQKIESLTGVDMVALELVSEGMPQVA